jgi:hypothetical protein
MRIRLADFQRVHIRAGETVRLVLEIRPEARAVVHDRGDPYDAPVCVRWDTVVRIEAGATKSSCPSLLEQNCMGPGNFGMKRHMHLCLWKEIRVAHSLSDL